MDKAYFKNIREEIISKLKMATSKIDIAMAWFTSRELFDTLLQCLHKGVEVNLILLDDPINWQPYAPDFNEFIAAGGRLRLALPLTGFLHHKFCVLDSRLAITGSYNWTYYAETRNLENIIISDDQNVVSQYAQEFDRLKGKFAAINSAKRYEWSDLELLPNVNAQELNSEIHCISVAKRMPVHHVIQANTVVRVVEKRFNPKAACHIGIKVLGENDKEILAPIIEKGATLPCTKDMPFVNYVDEREALQIVLMYGENQDAKDGKEMLSHDINFLFDNRTDDVLHIRVQMTMNTNGCLCAEVKCIETGKALELTTTNEKLISYDEEND